VVTFTSARFSRQVRAGSGRQDYPNRSRTGFPSEKINPEDIKQKSKENSLIISVLA